MLQLARCQGGLVYCRWYLSDPDAEVFCYEAWKDMWGCSDAADAAGVVVLPLLLLVSC